MSIPTHLHDVVIQVEEGCGVRDPIKEFLAEMQAVLHHAPVEVTPGKFTRFATSPRRGDEAGYCLMFPDLQAGIYGDFRSGLKGVWRARRGRPLLAIERVEQSRQLEAARRAVDEVQRKRWAKNRQRLDLHLDESRPVTVGDPVWTYLSNRLQTDLIPMPEVLRYHPNLLCWDKDKELGRFPAMIATLTNAKGEVVALHRTWLTPDGRKADVPTPKKLSSPAGPLTGGSIRLSWPQPGVRLPVFGVAEGIETALAAMLGSGVPTVAAYCAGALASWVWPPGIDKLVVFADHDDSGLRAAERLRARAARAGLPVAVLMPSKVGNDWCDVYAARGTSAGRSSMEGGEE